MKKNYHPYQLAYTSEALRGEDIDARPALVETLVKAYADPQKSLLDIGCGAGHKLKEMASYFGQAVGLEPSVPLLNQAREQAVVVRGTAQHLPFQNHTFDVVTSILSWWDPSEIFHVLKQKGILLIECLGPTDKIEFTKYFGKDEKGWRGAHLNTSFSEREEEIRNELDPFFDDISILNKEWLTAYSRQGLWALLSNTYSTVRHFDERHDALYFEEAVNALEKEGRIILKQNRWVIKAIKKDNQ